MGTKEKNARETFNDFDKAYGELLDALSHVVDCGRVAARRWSEFVGAVGTEFFGPTMRDRTPSWSGVMHLLEMKAVQDVHDKMKHLREGFLAGMKDKLTEERNEGNEDRGGET